MARIEPFSAPALLAFTPQDELETPPLPREHPKWVHDALAVSSRARQTITKIVPIVIRVLTFWDHHLRSITVGGRRLSIDASGSYRRE